MDERSPSQLGRLIRTVGRRRFVDLALRRGMRGLALGLGAALVLLAVDRLLGLRLPVVTSAVPAAAGLLAGVLAAWRDRPSPAVVAVELDRRLRLDDRLGTAISIPRLASERRDAGFAELVRGDAERRAAEIDGRFAAPLRMPRTLGPAALLAVALVAGTVLLPPRLLPRAAAQRPVGTADERSPAERAATVREIGEVIEASRASLEDDGGSDDPFVREQLDALDALARQLAEDPDAVDLDRARDESAARLDDAAERLAREARREIEAAEAAARRFEQMPAPDARDDVALDAPVDAAALRDALARGDLDEAAGTVERMLDRRERMSEAERRELADRLREMAARAQAPNAGDPTDGLEDQDARLRQALRDQGIDEPAIDDLLGAEPGADDDPAQQLAERGFERELAEDLARDIERLRDERATDALAREEADAIAEAVEDTARRLSDDAAAPPADDTTAPASDVDPSASEATERPAEGAAEPDDPRSEPGEAGGQRQAPDRPDEQRREPDRPGTPPREATPGGEEQSSRGAETGERRTAPDQDPPTGSETPPGERQRDPSAEPQAPPANPEGSPPAERAAPREASDGEPAAREDEQPPDGTPSAGPARSGADEPVPAAEDGDRQRDAGDEGRSGGAAADDDRSPDEALREIARRRDAARERLRRSRSLQDAARRMVDGMDEAERRQWAEQLARGDDASDRAESGAAAPAGPVPPEAPPSIGAAPAEDVDLRDETGGLEIDAPWLGPGDGGGTAGAVARGRIARDARRVAERAVNDATIPSRYHELIKRYFERLEQTAREAAEGDGG